MTVINNQRAFFLILVNSIGSTNALATEMYTFDDVVVSATRTEQSIKDVAAAVAVVDAASIAENLAQNVEQALEGEAGVSVPGTGRYGNSGFIIRGLSENYVKTLVDGVELPVSYNPGADVMRKYNNNIETDTLKRIEVNKGPSSSLYGSDALAGAVIMATKNPQDLLRTELDEIYASIKGGYYSVNDGYKATATLANRSGNLESLLIFTHREGHEIQTHRSGAAINGRDRGQADPFDINSDNLLVKAFYQLSDKHRIGVTGEIFNRDADGLILSNEGHQIMPGFIYTRNTAQDQDSRSRVTIEHQWLANLAWFDTLRWQLTALKTGSNHHTFDETASNGYRDRHREGTENSTQFDAQFNKGVVFANSYHEISAGLNVISNDFELNYRDIFLEGINAGNVVDKTGEVPNAKALKWGLFLQDQAFFLDEMLVVNAGLRYDSMRATPQHTNNDMVENSNNAVTGRLGMVYHWTETMSSYANISQGFKAPTLQDLYFLYETGAASGAIFTPNPTLRPEKSLGYETGLRFSPDFAQIDVSLFLNDYQDFIESRKLSDSTSQAKERWSKENINKAQIYGAEMNVRWAMDVLFSAPTGLYSQMNIAYAKGKDLDNGDAIDTVSPLTSYFAFGYNHQDDRIGGKISLKAVAAKSGANWSNANGINNINAPGYAVTDVTGFYRPSTQLTLRAGLFNAFDNRYWDYADLAGVDQNALGIDRRRQPGRHWGIEAEYVF